MNCVRVKPKGKGGCEKGRVTQQTCHRVAKHTRINHKGLTFRFCAQCDKEFGDLIGVRSGPCPCGNDATTKNLVSNEWECEDCFDQRRGVKK